MKVFWTGGISFIGQPLAQALWVRNWQTTVLVRHPESQAAQAALSCWPLEPLLRLVGLPAFLSREGARVGGSHLNYSSAKARRELGWQCLGSRTMWHEIIDAERVLPAERRGQGMVARLRPLPVPATVAGPVIPRRDAPRRVSRWACTVQTVRDVPATASVEWAPRETR